MMGWEWDVLQRVVSCFAGSLRRDVPIDAA